MKTTRLKYALLGSGAALAVIAASVPASASDIDEMRAQIQALQDKIAKIEVQEQRRVAPAAAVEAGSKPKSWKLPGTNTSMNIGGFAILQFDYDINGASSYGPANAPVDGSAGSKRQGEFDLNARQSRIFVSTSTPTDWGDLVTHIEFDMNGTGGQTVSQGAEYNSNQGAALRMRKAYGSLGPVLAGQDTTTFFTPGAGERTDVATPFLGSSAFRLGVVRYTHAFGGGTMLQVALEDPVNSGDTAAAGSVFGANNANGRGLSAAQITSITGNLANVHPTPAFVAQLSHKWSSGEIGLSFMGRELKVDNASTAGGALNDSTASWGLSLGSGVIISKQFRAGAQFLYGKSLGIYSGGESVLLTASGPQGNFAIDNVGVVGGAAFLQWRFTDTMRANVLYGREDYSYDLSKAELGIGTTGNSCASTTAASCAIDYTQMIAANIMWEPVPAVNIGLQYLYTINSLINSPNAKQSRLELAFRYSF
ncbi:MAG TPA: DcaP family trimeric outer membrane transporter [Alphaproteobacteria bacterium]|nr:DcaP family trimeric outer membrane transporter [Alphaproteobacteria bacterium]